MTCSVLTATWSTVLDANSCEAYYKNRPVNLVIASKGSSRDRITRLLGKYLEEHNVGKIRYEVWPGAGGVQGANKLRERNDDSINLGILHSVSTLAAHIDPKIDAPSLLDDLKVYGGVYILNFYLIVQSDSGIKHADDIFQSEKTLLLANRHDKEISAMSAVLLRSILDAPLEVVTGYKGRERSLSLLRGDTDLRIGSIRSFTDPSDLESLRILAQFADQPFNEVPGLEDVPLMFGPDGIAEQRIRSLGGDVGTKLATLKKVKSMMSLGHTLVGSGQVSDQHDRCVQQLVRTVFEDDNFADELGKIREPWLETDRDALHAKLRDTRDIIESVLRQIN